jgi:hypothetical protein
MMVRQRGQRKTQQSTNATTEARAVATTTVWAKKRAGVAMVAAMMATARLREATQQSTKGKSRRVLAGVALDGI